MDRVHAVGGTLEISSPRGRGTTLRARLPLIGALDGDASPARSPSESTTQVA
jgi:signal transduction histidine kinase